MDAVNVEPCKEHVRQYSGHLRSCVTGGCHCVLPEILNSFASLSPNFLSSVPAKYLFGEDESKDGLHIQKQEDTLQQITTEAV